jgi:hypothetical protein
MFRWVACLVGISAALVSSTARAGEETEAAPVRAAPPAYGESSVRTAPPEYVAEPAPQAPPLGHSGFQMALRSGISLPFGSAKDSFPGEAASPEHWSSSLDDLVGLQIPVTLDIGGKPNKHVFLGGYFTYARGFTAGRLAEACDRLPLDCYSSNVRFGAQIHYIFSPNDWLTPWVGYGFGYSWMSAGDGNRDTYMRGFDFAHFLGGVDFRFSRTLGLGLFVDYSLGSYAHQELSADSATVGAVDGSIVGRTIHQWFTIGPRLVVMP